MQPDIFLISSTLENASFVVTIVDPDAPTPQNRSISQFLHFLGGDFIADPTTGLLANSSPNLMEFMGPAPPAGSDPHRLVDSQRNLFLRLTVQNIQICSSRIQSAGQF